MRVEKMKVNYKIAISRWLPVILWAIVIFTFSSIQQIAVSQFFLWDFITKKIAHICEYAILFALIFRATRGNYLMSFILTMLYAVSDEFHQSFVPGRTCTILDLGFDLTGANIAAYIIWKLKPILQAKPKK
jgi:VanZ family protein